jgi:hypothetical protein
MRKCHCVSSSNLGRETIPVYILYIFIYVLVNICTHVNHWCLVSIFCVLGLSKNFVFNPHYVQLVNSYSVPSICFSNNMEYTLEILSFYS